MNMNNIKVSVIVPVYNAEKYIASCVESILSQTLPDLEVIFINDGSMDQSRKIIENYKKLNPQITLINQENQGVSMARNAGLQAATGEYIGFVDADDFIEKDMYETLYYAAKEGDCDAVISNFESELEGRKVITSYPFPIDTVLSRDYIEREILTYLIKSDQLNNVWNKIYKGTVINNNKVEFPEKVALGEDGMFNIRFFSNAGRVKFLGYSGYHYREVVGSATRDIVEKDYFKRAIEVYSFEIKEINSVHMNPVKMKKLKSLKLINSVISNINVYLNSPSNMSFTQRIKYVKNMINHPHVRDALPIYYSESYATLSRYEKFLAGMIQRKSLIGLYCATTYSKIRNTI